MSERQTKAGNLEVFFYVFLCFPMFSNVFQCYLLSFSLSLSLSHSLPISPFLTLTLFQSLIESLLTCWTTFVFISMLKTHPHTFSLSLSLAISLSHSHSFSLSHAAISHSITLDMLNKFCFHLYAQKSLFIGENCNAFFNHHHTTLTCYFRCHRAGSQLKICP